MSGREIDTGTLSRAEALFASEARQREPLPSTSYARKHYAETLAVAEGARDELVARLQAGVPAVHLARGYHDPAAFKAQGEILRLANAYRWASIALFKAAQLVCDSENIEDDDAADQGIRFEVEL